MLYGFRNETKEYKGMPYTVSKDLYGNHKAFNNGRYKTNPELSKEVSTVQNKMDHIRKISTLYSRVEAMLSICLTWELFQNVAAKTNNLSHLTSFRCNDNITLKGCLT